MPLIKYAKVFFKNPFKYISHPIRTIKKIFKVIPLRERVNELERRINYLEGRNLQLGFDQLGGRIDYRLTRLEMLSYWQRSDRYETLDEERKAILKDIEENYLQTLPRKFPRDVSFEQKNDNASAVIIKQEDNIFYWELFEKRIYMSYNYKSAYKIASSLYREFFTENPHRYLNPEKDGVDVPEQAVLADVGAAEGLLGILFIERCKKLYLFENDPNWIEMLRRTFAPYHDKVEIIKGTVGDRDEDIKLDEFFKDKEMPNFIKMDVEGYEPAVLRGMPNILGSDNPLTMLICTYHRQDDYDTFYNLLNKNYDITPSKGYFWHMPDPMPPFFRRGIMRAVKKISKKQ